MERYEPKSSFLRSVIVDEVTFQGEFGAANLERLIAMTRDLDDSNRDWAVMLLGQMKDLDSPQIMAALMRATKDNHFATRSEAVFALAVRGAPEARDLVRNLLEEEAVGALAVEAAGYVASAELLPILEELRDWWDVDEELLGRAIEACRALKKSE